MTKHAWRSISTLHFDAEKEEQIKWMKIGNKLPLESLPCQWRIWDTALRPKKMAFKACLPYNHQRGYLWVVKLVKNINHGNKERNLRNKSEAINLVEDFQRQYESLYTLYEDLREEVKKNIGFGDGESFSSSSTSSSDSESYYSLGGSNTVQTPHRRSNSKNSSFSSDINQELDPTSDLEDTILKDKLTSSSEVKSITNQYSHLEGQVESLKLEVSKLFSEKEKLKEVVECKSDEAMQMKEKISSLEGQVLEADAKLKENESRFYSVKHSEDSEKKKYLSRISDLEAQAKNVQLKLDSLKDEKVELERRVFEETEKSASLVKGLTEQVSSLKNILANANTQKSELISELEKKSKEKSECLILINNLKNESSVNEQKLSKEKEGLKAHARDLELKIHSLLSTKTELEDQIKKLTQEASQSSAEVSESHRSLSEKENELSTERKKLTDFQNITSAKTKSLEDETKSLKTDLESIKNEKTELEDQIKKLTQEASQSSAEVSKTHRSLSEKENELSTERKKLTDFQNITSAKTKSLEYETKSLKTDLESIKNEKIHLQTIVESLQTELDKEKGENSQNRSKLEKLSKSNFQIVERKVEDLLEEFRKQLEDKYRILSRRIRVAEQLQVENKEWYRKTKESYEQQNKDLKARAERNEIELKSIKDMTLTANKVLTSLDSVALNFEECSANFLNRISKASCELKFAKHWAMRKNKAVLHVRDEMDCLLAQLDDKEKEILVVRERVWKSENKVRELEKMVKEKEDTMLGLKEEKREAIRQLCVWIDYHRGRSDYYMKMLSELNPTCKKAS
ncbi:myosin heavy chain-related family protein [Striga asiatica]|uniref:Myosin heavy chain-related family protein n=1 Tax=Striga asiatica TaxID=4170 RepID=A0A5A7PJR6_STRAF|nr:myosin heavy chain-related family protein [Striga asiatica]